MCVGRSGTCGDARLAVHEGALDVFERVRWARICALGHMLMRPTNVKDALSLVSAMEY